MKIQRGQQEGGFITLVVLTLLLMMVTLLSINGAALVRLQRETKEIEKQQIRRVVPSTNQPPVARP